VFVECTENTGVPGLGLCGQEDNPALRDRRRLAEERMQRAGSKDGGSVYTESDREVQIGNSGLTGK
jgi:phage-related baseplate assembly protein